ncbi:hypothetical protein WR25_10381 [Diploscapter pachys]|uniref:Calponin-homology (CH) domain-containing protein n=1 Tax=Diploscapter pachys TaxID=2018661 RepID=A0A2A2KZ28_9BILA|nr:hypothetical protein WR25_10381 [Diploscapter pachys]
MAAGWKKFTGHSQYPELTSNPDGSAFCYGSKKDRGFRLSWLQGKRDDQIEHEILQWVSRVTSERLPHDRDGILEVLHDGKILCKLVLRLNPRSLPRPVNQKPAVFSATDNMLNFLEALENIGLAKDELFFPNELLEKRDLTGLIATLKRLKEKIGA